MVRERVRRRPELAKPKGILPRLGRWCDEAIFSLAPVWGSKRRAARQLSELSQRRLERLYLSWDSDTDSRVRGDRWLASGLSPDTILEQSIRELQNRSAQLYRKNNVAHAAIEGRVGNEVGIGITAQPRVRAFTKARNREINDGIKDVIERWSESGVDKSRRLTLGGLQRQVCRTFATYGEAFVLLGNQRYRGSIPLAVEVIAPERVETPPGEAGNPNVRMGVKFDANGEVLGYYVRESHPGDYKRTSFKHKFYPRFDKQGQSRMLHVFEPLFAGQSRGLPWLCAAMNRIKDLDDFFEAELIAKQVEACFGLIFKGGPDSLSPMDEAEGAKSSTEAATGKRLENLEPGMVHYSSDGEEVTTVDPNRPGSTFAPFIELSLRSISAALNYPYEMLAKNFFRTTFSSGRLAMLDGRVGFRMRRQVLIEQFLSPLHQRVIYEAVFVDELGGLIDLLDYRERPWVFTRHKWVGQGWSFIDPEKEVKAHVLAKDEDIETFADIYAEQGEEWDEQFEQRLVEKGVLVEQEVELRKKRMDLEKAAGLAVSEEILRATAVKSGAPGEADDSDSDDEEQEQHEGEMAAAN